MTQLVGQSPERTISPYRPVRDHEIARPALIKKDAIVQMRYQSPGMEITTTGQAMADGSKGRMIAVRNLASKKVVHA
ncbi:MAG: flagellar basal body P-ring formation chaperone FlgA, partial [candidate division NC10 bacterium]